MEYEDTPVHRYYLAHEHAMGVYIARPMMATPAAASTELRGEMPVALLVEGAVVGEEVVASGTVMVDPSSVVGAGVSTSVSSEADPASADSLAEPELLDVDGALVVEDGVLVVVVGVLVVVAGVLVVDPDEPLSDEELLLPVLPLLLDELQSAALAMYTVL